MRFAFIRHLPTPWNEEGKLQGKRNIEISEISDFYSSEIMNNKQYLSNYEPFSKIVVSTLTRTHQTAQLYGYDHYMIEPLLDELDFGEFEGKEKKRLIETYKDKWFTNPREIHLGESLVEFEERISLFLKKYKNSPPILVFGHGSWIRACMSYLQYGSINKMNQIELKNNALIVIE